MFKVIIKNLAGIETHGTQFLTREECEAWVKENTEAFGKPERLVPEEMLHTEDISKSLEVIIEPSIVGDKKFNKFAATFSYDITDVTAKLAQDKLNADSLAYLAKTDWYVIRKQESGAAIPEEILTARASARATIVK